MKPAKLWVLTLALGGCAAPLAPRSARPVGSPPRAGSTPAPVAPASAGPVSPPVVRAEQALTLERALALALERDPGLEFVRAELAAARAREAAAGRWSNPQLIAGMESAPLDGDTFDEAELLLGISQSFPLSGRRAREREVRLREREGAAHQAHARLVAVRREVSGAFATALHAQQLGALYRELADNTARAHDLLATRVEAGDAIASELAAAGLAHARSARDLRRADLLAQRSLTELAAALGDPACAIESVAGDLGVALELPAIAALVQRLDEHPGVLAAHSRARAAEAGIEFAEAARIPDLRLDLIYRREQELDSNAFDVVIGLPLPLFNNGAASVEESRQLLARARASERSTRIAAETDLRLAHLTVARALEELEFQELEILPRMTALRDVARKQYELGDTSLAAALAAHRAWLEVRRAMLDTQRDLMQAWVVLGAYLRDTGS